MESQALPGKTGSISQEVLRKRILLCDGQGNPLETPEEMFWRVAWEVGKVERQFSDSVDVRETAASFANMMQALEFLPNSPTLMNAGLPHGQLSACFVLPLEDSMESIFRTLRDTALILRRAAAAQGSPSLVCAPVVIPSAQREALPAARCRL